MLYMEISKCRCKAWSSELKYFIAVHWLGLSWGPEKHVFTFESFSLFYSQVDCFWTGLDTLPSLKRDVRFARPKIHGGWVILILVVVKHV